MTPLTLEVMENFHLRFADLMAERGLSYRRLAAMLKERGRDVSHEKVGAWARGERVPDLAEAAELASIFGVSLEYLATGEEAARHTAITERERDVLKAAHVVGVDRALKRIMAADQPAAEEPAAGWRPLVTQRMPEPRKPRPKKSGQAKGNHKGADRK